MCLLHGCTLGGNGFRCISDFFDEVHLLCDQNSVVRIHIAVVTCLDQCLYLEVAVVDVIVLVLEDILQATAHMESVGAEIYLASELVDAPDILLSLALHVFVSCLEGINFNPLVISGCGSSCCLKVISIDTVLLADDIGVDMRDNLNFDVVSVCVGGEGFHDLGKMKDGITANAVFLIGGGQRLHDGVDSKHNFNLLFNFVICLCLYVRVDA